MVKLTKEQQSISWKNRRLAREHFFGSKEGRTGWCLHHKDETLRERDLDRYIQWRIEDLVPMTKAEHTALHKKGNQYCLGVHLSDETKRKISISKFGKHLSIETRKRISEATKGEHNPMFGRTHSEESKRKMSELKMGENNPNFGKVHSDETRRKLREQKLGLKFWNNGIINVRSRECPAGFVAGRLKH